MNRREFFGLAAASIFAPRFGRWYRQGSGLIVRDVQLPHWMDVPPEMRGILSVDSIDRGGRLLSVTRRGDPPLPRRWVAFDEPRGIRPGDRIRLLRADY